MQNAFCRMLLLNNTMEQNAVIYAECNIVHKKVFSRNIMLRK